MQEYNSDMKISTIEKNFMVLASFKISKQLKSRNKALVVAFASGRNPWRDGLSEGLLCVYFTLSYCMCYCERIIFYDWIKTRRFIGQPFSNKMQTGIVLAFLKKMPNFLLQTHTNHNISNFRHSVMNSANFPKSYKETKLQFQDFILL